jgi:hypothetical protein
VEEIGCGIYHGCSFRAPTGGELDIKPARRAIQEVAVQEKNTTLAELTGIRTAQTIGCRRPAAAMQTPIRL